MRLLLDTHAFLWFIGGDKRLSDKAKAAISDLDNEVFLSSESLWEIAVKMNIGKLRLPEPFAELIPAHLVRNEITVLHAEVSHMAQYIALPLHHRDPFDRMIIVQAQEESLTLVSKDGAFAHYDVGQLW